MTIGTILLCIGCIGIACAAISVCKKKKQSKNKNISYKEPDKITGVRVDQETQSVAPTISAKDAFISNIQLFESLLPQLDTGFDKGIWTEKIVSINNPLLIEVWKKCCNDVNMWKRILSSWGVRQDTCRSFTFLNRYSNLYGTIDGNMAVEGLKYRVLNGAWILTNDTTGEKKVLKKGIIEKL